MTILAFPSRPFPHRCRCTQTFFLRPVAGSVARPQQMPSALLQSSSLARSRGGRMAMATAMALEWPWRRWMKKANKRARRLCSYGAREELSHTSVSSLIHPTCNTWPPFIKSITTHPTKCRVDHPHNKFNKSVGLQAG